jgi:hypothetical protein
MTEKLCCRSLVFLHFRGGYSSFSFSSSYCWLSSILNHFFQVFIEKCYSWLSNSCGIPSALTSSNPACCAGVLTSSTVFSTGPNVVYLCINYGRCLHQSPFQHISDTSSKTVLVLILFKMSDDRH